MKKMKNDNKGFTLVELIVVLVILAILAAILVPALLGYIDEAKNSQLELHGKSVYTAAQASASKYYGKTKSNDIQSTDKASFVADVARISEIDTFGTKGTTKAYIGFGSTTKGTDTATTRQYFTVNKIYYTEDGKIGAKLEDGVWELIPDWTKITTTNMVEVATTAD